MSVTSQKRRPFTAISVEGTGKYQLEPGQESAECRVAPVLSHCSLLRNRLVCWSIVVKEKPTVGTPFFGAFPSDRIHKAKKDVSVHFFVPSSNSYKLCQRIPGNFWRYCVYNTPTTKIPTSQCDWNLGTRCLYCTKICILAGNVDFCELWGHSQHVCHVLSFRFSTKATLSKLSTCGTPHLQSFCGVRKGAMWVLNGTVVFQNRAVTCAWNT